MGLVDYLCRLFLKSFTALLSVTRKPFIVDVFSGFLDCGVIELYFCLFMPTMNHAEKCCHPRKFDLNKLYRIERTVARKRLVCIPFRIFIFTYMT